MNLDVFVILLIIFVTSIFCFIIYTGLTTKSIGFMDMTCEELLKEYKSDQYTLEQENKILSIMILKKCELE
jgi:hypothetical protein